MRDAPGQLQQRCKADEDPHDARGVAVGEPAPVDNTHARSDQGRADQSTDERMTAVVPISIGPKTGNLATVFSVSWASRAAPSGLTYEVDMARPPGVFVPWYSGSVRGATFIPDAGVGKSRFRARLISSADDTVGSGWVTKAITVS